MGPVDGSGVTLRRFQHSDAESVHRWFNNPRATRNLMEQRSGFSVDDAQAWTERAMSESGEDRKFAILAEGHSDPVGFTALYGLFRQGAPELGILIGDRVRIPGIGRVAEAQTIAEAFDRYGARRVYGRIPARNRAAKWVVESLGWQHEVTMRGHLRADGQQAEDCEIWGVLPDEFRAASADLFG
jgi:RimJ/RimL family protein N-acetyltransferase